MKKIIVTVLIGSLFFSCKKEATTQPAEPKLELNYSTPPVPAPAGTKFAKDISYGNDPNSRFDIFLPASSGPTALVVFIHGGGFVSGDKSDIYTESPYHIQSYLQNNIAFASINYKFRTTDLQEDILTSLNDIKRCIQFIRYHANSFHIDKQNLACYGGSAGGGASIYLAFHPDMAEPLSPDPISKESTWLKAAGHLVSQCSYDPITMNEIFKAAGMDFLSVPGLKESVMANFGVSSFDQLYTDPNVIALRKELDMLGWMTADDPPFFVGNSNPNTVPTDRSQSIHHPIHGKALVDKAKTIGLECVAYIPSMNIYPPNNETISSFLIRQLKK